jgi:hypothetical protein
MVIRFGRWPLAKKQNQDFHTIWQRCPLFAWVLMQLLYDERIVEIQKHQRQPPLISPSRTLASGVLPGGYSSYSGSINLVHLL